MIPISKPEDKSRIYAVLENIAQATHNKRIDPKITAIVVILE